MENIYGKSNPKSRFCLWVKISTDPYARYRGFSLLGREFVVYGGRKVKHQVKSTLDNKPTTGNFYPVHEAEWIRVVPEMAYSRHKSKFWFIPADFCLHFVRPMYNKPVTYRKYGLENRDWTQKPELVRDFNKYSTLDKEIPKFARNAADVAYHQRNSFR